MSIRATYNPVKDHGLLDIDILSLIFDSPLSMSTDETVLHAEADDPTNQITKAQCREYTQRLGHILRHEYDIGANGAETDVVVCLATGQVLVPSLFYGVIAAGGIYSGASPSFTAAELARQLSQGSCKLLVASEDCKDIALQAAEQYGLPSSKVLIIKSQGGERSLRACSQEDVNLLEKYHDHLEWEKISDPAVLRTRTCCLFYSSGTTGEPKGVRISQQNLTSSAQVSLFNTRDYVRRQEKKSPGFKLEYRTIAHLPMAHIAGAQGYLLHPSVCAGTVYWMPRFDYLKFLSYCKTYRVSIFFTVPPIYQLLVTSPLVTDQFQHMIHALSGAAPMSAELAQKVEKKLGCTVAPTWGMTETTGSATLSPWDMSVTDGSLSPILANMRVRIVDDDENDVGDGEVGEFLVQGPMVTPGYWHDAEASRECFTADGAWFKTGDMGYRQDGKFFIGDRKREMIKYKGYQVAPTELETLLRSHPEIKDAVVIGVPDLDIAGNELPRAYVVADQTKVSEDMIKDYVKENLAHYKQLRGGVMYTDAVPRSPTGKVLRRQLKEAARASAKGNL